MFAPGFGDPFLITNNYRVSYALDAAANPDGAVPTPKAGVPLAAAAPTQPLRKAFYTNDLRNGKWAPNSPTLLCGGDQDPTVFFSVNTGTMAEFWSPGPGRTGHGARREAAPGGPFAPVQTGFQASQAHLLAFYESAAGGGLSPAAAQEQLVQKYHTNVAPFCAVAARTFFASSKGGSTMTRRTLRVACRARQVAVAALIAVRGAVPTASRQHGAHWHVRDLLSSAPPMTCRDRSCRPGSTCEVKNTQTAYFAYIRRLTSHLDLEIAFGVPPKTKTEGKGPATVGSVPYNGLTIATAWLAPSALLEYKLFDESHAPAVPRRRCELHQLLRSGSRRLAMR